LSASSRFSEAYRVAVPSIVQAEHSGGYKIRVRFNNGSKKTIDFSRWFNGPVFEPLRDVDYFKRFFLDTGTIAWPNGTWTSDIAPEALYEAQAVHEAA